MVLYKACRLTAQTIVQILLFLHNLSNEVKYLWDLGRQRNPSIKAAEPWHGRDRSCRLCWGATAEIAWALPCAQPPQPTAHVAWGNSFRQKFQLASNLACDLKPISESVDGVSGLLSVDISACTGAQSLPQPDSEPVHVLQPGPAPHPSSDAQLCFSRTRAHDQPASVPGYTQDSSSLKFPDFYQDKSICLTEACKAPPPPSCPLSRWGSARWREPPKLTLRQSPNQGESLGFVTPPISCTYLRVHTVARVYEKMQNIFNESWTRSSAGAECLKSEAKQTC